MKILKPVSIQAIYNAQEDKNCEEFLDHFKDILLWWFKGGKYECGLRDNIPEHIIKERCKDPKRKEFYVKHGFVGEDVTYRVGQLFQIDGKEYHLLRCGPNDVVFLDIHLKNRFGDHFKVADTEEITKDEINKKVENYSWRLL